MSWDQTRTRRTRTSGSERHAADLFFADLMGERPRRRHTTWVPEAAPAAPAAAPCGCHGAAASNEAFVEAEASDETAWDEAMVGQAVIAGRTCTIDPAATPLWSGSSLEDALREALARTTAHTVVLGDPIAGGAMAVHEWGSRTSLPAPLTIELDTTAIAALVVNGGDRVYLRADLLAGAGPSRLRWVHVPGIASFAALPAAQRTSQRDAWIRKIRAAAAINPATRVAFTVAELGALASPVLRLLLARHAAGAFPVGTHARGGVVHGVTLPMLRRPLAEPQVYQRVISMREGKLESINAWDLEAGISLGPVQINVQRAALFRFLWRVWQEDRALFTSALGAAPTWAMRETAGVPELSVPVAGAPQWLHGRTASADVTRNYAWFQSGDPTRAAAADVDPTHRRDLAARFRELVVWPHIQDLLEDVTSWWLQPGLDMIHAAGIPALSATSPDRDTFILKSLLLSTYVRFSGCLQPLLDALAPWTSVADKLAHWRTALSTMTGPCRTGASATVAQRDRNANLLTRLGHQETDAADVFAAMTAVTAAAAPVAAPTGAAAPPSASARTLRPGEAARLFDAAVAGDEGIASASGMRVLARPGQGVPASLPARTWLITRALGEGRLATLAEVHSSAEGHWELRGPTTTQRIGRVERMPRDRLLLAEAAEDDPLITRCGFFGPNVQRTEQEVRDAVVAAARAEWTRWHDASGAAHHEGDTARFGDLVRYYLAVISAAHPDTLTAMQAIAVAPTTAYGALLTTTSTATINTEAARVRALIVAGVPGATSPANLDAQVEDALKHARQAHLNRGAWRAWSAVWVSNCVRTASIGLGLEAMIQGNHSGRDELLRVSAAHRVYALEAHQRRVGPNRRDGTYHAFAPDAFAPLPGDIIVQDRQHDDPAQLMTYAGITGLAGGLETHGDIVVEVSAGSLVTIGGNVGDSVRRRRYPLDTAGRLVRAANQLYTQESDSGTLATVPSTSTAALASNSTLRIFTLLRPVQVCAAVPGQPYHGGILT